MSFRTVCRFCLARNVRMHAIAGSPLQGVYEKLTSTLLNTARWPVMACYICYSHLKKCHNLLVRSMRVDEVLTKIQQSGEVLKDQSLSMLSQIQYELSNGLCFTPVEVIAIDSKDIEHNLIETEVKEEPEQCDEEMGMDTSICVEHMKCEVSENEPDMEADGLEHIQDDESQELINEDNIKDELLEDVLDIEEDELKCGDLQHEESGKMECLNSMVPEGTTTSEECKQTRKDNIKHVINQTTSLRNVVVKLTRLEMETQSRTAGTHTSQRNNSGSRNRQVSTNTSMFSDTAINKENISVNSDNDDTSTDVDVDDGSSKHIVDMFISNSCGDMFDDKYHLIEHIKRHDVDKRSTEQVSGERSSHQRVTLHKRRLTRTRVVNKHTETDSKINRFECEICKVRFIRKDILNRHSQTHTGVKPFECEICKVRFTLKGNLNTHLRTHTGEKPFECEICQVRFIDRRNLNKHLCTHTGEKPFVCEICKVRFNRKDALKTHSQIHTGVKLFECEICKVRFNRKDTLKTHSQIHTGVKPFECEICKVRFCHKSSLNKHLRTHTGEKPFECEICKVRFNRKDGLKSHSQTHTGVKLFECEICKVRFTFKNNLNTHLRTHSGVKPFECEICKLKFYRNDQLRKHLETHRRMNPFVCDVPL